MKVVPRENTGCIHDAERETVESELSFQKVVGPLGGFGILSLTKAKHLPFMKAEHLDIVIAGIFVRDLPLIKDD